MTQQISTNPAANISANAAIDKIDSARDKSYLSGLFMGAGISLGMFSLFNGKPLLAAVFSIAAVGGSMYTLRKSRAQIIEGVQDIVRSIRSELPVRKP